MVHNFSHGGLKHVETPSTGDMKLEGPRNLKHISKCFCDRKPPLSFSKIVSMESVSHSTASLIIQPLLQALLLWSPIKGLYQLTQLSVLENISVHTTVP